MTEITDKTGKVIGRVEAVTLAQARFEGERIRSPRPDEMNDDDLESELAIHLSRLMC